MVKKNMLGLLVSGFAFLFCSAQDRDALIALYNATNGPNWTINTNWASAAPLDTWYGITTDAMGRVIEIDLNPFDNSGNNLLGNLPMEIGDLTSLERLDIANNPGLTGAIPNSIGNLTLLTAINFSNNNLSGAIPDSFANLLNLEDLVLSQNAFTGTIPDYFGNFTNLTRLLMNDNQFAGPIPASLGNLINLNVLWLSRNELGGNIPPSLGNLVGLQSLLLFFNQLSGNIPPEFGNLSSLIGIDLSYNELSAEIPEELGNISTLQHFGASNNQFSGGIPASLGNLTNLISFSVQGNNLSGALPNSLSQWTNIGYIDIQNNSFEGPIPSFTFDLTQLNPRFNFENNRFQFGDFENDFTYYSSSLAEFTDNPQAPVNDFVELTPCLGQEVVLRTEVSGTANVYQWFKNNTAIPDSNTPDLVLDAVNATDSGTYTCLISSAIVTDLILERNPIILQVGNGPTANPIEEISVCDSDGDGIAVFTFDLAAVEAQVVGGQTGLTVSYFYETGAPLALSSPFTNSIPFRETITVRVESSPECFAETPLVFSVIDLSTLETVSDASACEEFVLPVLPPGGQYYTQTNQGGNALSPGDVIDQSQRIYVYTEVEDCSTEYSFEVVIDNNVANCDTDQPQEPIEQTSLPTFFTPNGDGINDVWDISILSGQANSSVYIFDRYGRLLKQLNPQLDMGWDGTFNGSELPSSDYWYTLTTAGGAIISQGHFSLKR